MNAIERLDVVCPVCLGVLPKPDDIPEGGFGYQEPTPRTERALTPVDVKCKTCHTIVVGVTFYRVQSGL